MRGGLTVAVTGRGRALIVNFGITEMERNIMFNHVQDFIMFNHVQDFSENLNLS